MKKSIRFITYVLFSLLLLPILAQQPDPYVKGKTGSVLINIGAKGDGSYGLTGWNYDTQKVEQNNVITKTYKTIEASEYQWTTENLRLKYGTYASINMNWVNLTQADVDKFANEYLNGQKIPLEEFEQVFGTWVTLYDVAMMYRNIYWGIPKGDGTFDHTWGLPTKEDIWQLYGQAPRTSGNVYEDIKDFLFASACDNKYNWTQNMFNRRNISGLTLTPVGMRESNQGGAIYGFGQVVSLQTASWAGIETLSDRDLSGQGGIISNPYSYHFTQARHRRPLTDQELGYKMYIDAANDQILMLPYNQASSLPELAKGLERGIALRYANREHLKVLKKWSEIQAEATEIKSKLAPTNYPAPPALLPCPKEPEPDITADPYTKGKESAVLINIGAKGDGSYGLTGWNYDTQKVEVSNVITKTYKTIEASEYQWTTENLRLKYGTYASINMNWVNLTQTDVDKYSADYLSGKSVPLDEFEQVYGTWSTLYDVAMMYRNIYWGVPTGVNTFDHTWGLPTKEDIWQLYGQAPRTTDNFYNDIKDFLFASSSDFNFGWAQGLFKNKNISGLTLTPLGMRESNQGGAIYGFGQVTSLQTNTWAAIETLSDRDLSGRSGLISNPYSYHFTQARHRRPLTDQELGYKMYIDAANDQVLMLPYDQVSTLAELPKGLERGIALRYTNRKHFKVLQKWSKIKEEADLIRRLIAGESVVIPIDPLEPIDPVEPIDPIDPVDPIDPIDPIEPLDPSEEYCENAEDIVEFTYDLSGNRIKKEIILNTTRSAEVLPPFFDQVDNQKIIIYPNPTRGQLMVEIPGLVDIKSGSLTVFSLMGQTITKKTINQRQTDLDISNSPAGTYILHININGKISTWKIIKQ